MPEAAEACTMAMGLRCLIGENIISITAKGMDKPTHQFDFIKKITVNMLPMKIVRVWSYGKKVIIDVIDATGRCGHFFFELAMTGIILIGNVEKCQRYLWEYGQVLPGTGTDKDSTSARIYQQKGYFSFCDGRKWATVSYLSTEELHARIRALGPNILDMKDASELYQHVVKMKRTRTSIASKLVDQKIFCGAGNYVRSEALYLARIHPMRRCTTITNEELLRLSQAVFIVIHHSYKLGGYSLRDYYRPDGTVGGYKSVIYSKVKILRDGKEYPVSVVSMSKSTKSGQRVYYDPSVQLCGDNDDQTKIG